MLNRFFRLSLVAAYLALTNYCFICSVNAGSGSQSKPSHCATPSPKKSCCDASSDKRSNSDACSFSMDNSSTVLKTVDIPVKPVILVSESLSVLGMGQTLPPIIAATRNHGPPIKSPADRLTSYSFQGRAPPSFA